MSDNTHIPIHSGQTMPPFDWPKLFDKQYMGQLVSLANSLRNCPQIKLTEVNASVQIPAAQSLAPFQIYFASANKIRVRAGNIIPRSYGSVNGDDCAYVGNINTGFFLNSSVDYYAIAFTMAAPDGSGYNLIAIPFTGGSADYAHCILLQDQSVVSWNPAAAQDDGRYTRFIGYVTQVLDASGGWKILQPSPGGTPSAPTDLQKMLDDLADVTMKYATPGVDWNDAGLYFSGDVVKISDASFDYHYINLQVFSSAYPISGGPVNISPLADIAENPWKRISKCPRPDAIYGPTPEGGGGSFLHQ